MKQLTLPVTVLRQIFVQWLHYIHSGYKCNLAEQIRWNKFKLPFLNLEISTELVKRMGITNAMSIHI